jgi:adenylate cyclase
MPKEIERKFLVNGSDWKTVRPEFFRQGYLNTDPERTVRVRIADEKAWLTIKGITRGCTRSEFEYSLPLKNAEELLELCEKPIIEKLRYKVPVEGHLWEVDEFLGENEGLVLAEIELEEEGQRIILPVWIEREVTDDPRYYNANLVEHPFRRWSDESA